MKTFMKFVGRTLALFFLCQIFVAASCNRNTDPEDDEQQQLPIALLNYRISITESVLNLTDISVDFYDNKGNIETELITFDNTQEEYLELRLFVKEYRFDDFPASFNCKVRCTPKTDIDPYQYCTQDENGEWIINDTWGVGLGHIFYIDSALVSIEGEQWYPTGMKLYDLDYLCENIDGKFLEINIDENGEIIKSSIAGHKFVDLGLPSGLKWAAYNVGAESPEEYGDYFAWGEIQPKDAYTEENCSSLYLYAEDISGHMYLDAARANWGSPWRMPTEQEIIELVLNTNGMSTELNGVRGTMVTGSNGNSIFFPYAGKMIDTTLYDEGDFGYYYSSSLTKPITSDSGPYYYYVDDTQGTTSSVNRYPGFTIRPVVSN